MQAGVLAKPTSHLSLHYDGIRVDAGRVALEGGDGDSMCRYLEEHVRKHTGYDVQLAVKHHMTFNELCGVHIPDCEVTIPSADHVLLKRGKGRAEGCARACSYEAVFNING